MPNVPATKTTGNDAPQEPPAPGPDYVPCKLTLAQLRLLQRTELAPTLSPADVEKLQANVITAAGKEKPDPSVSGPAFGELVERLGSRATTANLIGLTPSQALSKIIEIFRVNRDKNATDADVNWYVSLVEAAASDPTVAGSQQVSSQDYRNYSNSYSKEPGSNASAKKDTVANLAALLDQIGEIGAPSNKEGEREIARPALYPKVTQAVGESELSQGTKAFVLKQLGNRAPLDSSDLVEAARQFLETLSTPKDIGCAMSLLTWREVEYAFGYLIANEYIAVQVVVRNLNEKQQFVMHDVEFEVDADPTGRLGRFYSGRDKIVVRALANSQSTGDPRNLTLNTVAGIGQVMATAATIFGGSLVDAQGVFNGAFLPQLKIGWKDLSADQMKMIDDNTFSSAASSQTVVPKSGTVVFYTFIPSKQFEEGWWTQPCVDTIYLGRWDKSTGTISNLSLGTYGQQMPDAGDVPYGSTNNKTAAGSSTLAGVDVRRALEVCARNQSLLPRSHSRWSTMWKRGPLLKTKDDETVVQINAPTDDDPQGKQNLPPPGDFEKGTTKTKDDDPTSETGRFELFRNAYARPYRKWSGNALAIFRELANTVVAGVHIVDQTDLLASVTKLDCGDQVDDKGVVDYDKLKNDSLVCSLVGKNLDKIAKVKLRNGADALDPATADSQVLVTGDSTKASVSWPAKTLEALPGTDYLLYAVVANSAEQKTIAAVHLPDIPYATSVTNATQAGTAFDLSAKDAKPLTLTVKGYRMDKVTGAILTPSVDTKIAAESDSKITEEAQAKSSRKTVDGLKLANSPTRSATEVSFTLDAESLKPLGDGGATISLKSSDASKPLPLPPALGITVKLTADSPPVPVGTNTNSKNDKKKKKTDKTTGKKKEKKVEKKTGV